MDNEDYDTWYGEGWEWGMHHDSFTSEDVVAVPSAFLTAWADGFKAALDWRQQGARR